MVVLGGEAVAYERGTAVHRTRGRHSVENCMCPLLFITKLARVKRWSLSNVSEGVQKGAEDSGVGFSDSGFRLEYIGCQMSGVDFEVSREVQLSGAGVRGLGV